MTEGACENTDRELWRERFGDFYADSIHVTKDGSIGINVSGHVIVMPLQKWHALAAEQAQPVPEQFLPRCPSCNQPAGSHGVNCTATAQKPPSPEQ